MTQRAKKGGGRIGEKGAAADGDKPAQGENSLL